MIDRKKVIKGLECCSFDRDVFSICKDCPYSFNGEKCENNRTNVRCCNELKDDLLLLLKEQEPKTPIHIHEEYPEHDWETDEDGNIDEWAMDFEFHNGPMCKRCGYSFCVHCKPNGWNEEPCVIDYYQCPKCEERIYKGFENIVYCKKCGQAVKWE